MRILQFTAGAADMYCGSCLRDNALAAHLMALGHEVLLVPIYTPTRTDEPNVSHEKVFFGGISVFLEQHVPLFRKTPRVLDRLWDSPWALKLASKRSIQIQPHRLGELTLSMLRGEDGFQRKELSKLTDWLQTQPLPDVVNIPNCLLLGMADPIRKAIDRPVCCTLQGEDLFLEGLDDTHRHQAIELIRGHVASVDAFVGVSHFHARSMSRLLNIPAYKIHAVPLGIEVEGYKPRIPAPDGIFRIGYLARISPEKGLHLLTEAYAKLRLQGEIPKMQLHAAGYLAPQQRDYLQGIQRQLQAGGLGEEFHYHGTLDREQKREFLRRLDVFSVPATYDEPKGMFLLEAMACAVPVVQPRRGAFVEVVQDTSGGLLVEPDDPDSLAEGLAAVYRDKDLAAKLGRDGAEGVRREYTVGRMAKRTLEVYRNLLTIT